MNSEELKKRFKVFALRIIKLSNRLPNDLTGQTIAKQIIRSGTSPGANYRAACLGKSDKDFLNKLKIVEEELDETLYWLELIIEAELLKSASLDDLVKENQELLKIIVSLIRTMKKKLNQGMN
ncbi:four helix bundle protein [Sunxiuqinia elliptica]|uniref:Four helix bundle protein n=1 Tax=Sunxiuqinia elliptica TaxID=655355 RepID=A0A4R6GU83_9BACT|nr:four helix bundle protein [Sunxiuqinia elliptica]TDN98244.1 four helix bundle protein [Sunxiuqinia elliptica]TDO60350.1 four helix bundle protein [Sunxiuqinia elliptica]